MKSLKSDIMKPLHNMKKRCQTIILVFKDGLNLRRYGPILKKIPFKLKKNQDSDDFILSNKDGTKLKIPSETMLGLSHGLIQAPF